MSGKELAAAIAERFGTQGWRWHRCMCCSVSFFTAAERSDCGARSCAVPTGKSESRRPVFWEDLWPTVTESFTALGFNTTYRRDLVNHVGDTRFVGAGLQIFESALYEGNPVPQGRLFVPQPVMRLNYLKDVARSDGFSTAFLNVCTEQASASIEDYVEHVGSWLMCLAKLGIATRDVTLLRRASFWSGGPFRGYALTVLVSGVEVGDIVYIDHSAMETPSLLPIVDTSFGLERLVFALNTGLSYTALLGPLPQSAMSELRVPLDQLRTATLMLMAGLSTSSRGRGRILRELMTVDVPRSQLLDVDEVVAHAYDYWSTFYPAEIDRTACQGLVRSERSRHVNGHLLDAVGRRGQGRGDVTLTSHEFCRQLLKSGLTQDTLAVGASKASLTVKKPVGRTGQVAQDPRSTLTIITPTSPIPSHPATEMIEQAIRSLVRLAGVAGCRHLIVCDGDPDARGPEADNYVRYKRKLQDIVAAGGLGTQAELIQLDRCEGLAGVMNAAVAQVATPYLLTWEHDWLLTRRFNTSAVLGVFASQDVHYVRLNKRHTHEAGWDSVLKPDARERDVPLVRTGCWSANPHFARTSHYRSTVMPHVRIQLGGGSDGFEHPVFRAYQSDIHRLGFDSAQRKWGVFIYGHMGDAPLVTHLDGRGSVPSDKTQSQES